MRSVRLVRAMLGRIPLPKAPSGVIVRTEHAGSVRLLVHGTQERLRPSGALVWIHGGGLIFGVPEQSADHCNRLAAELDILVVNVDYRIAPEHPFPAALDDCVAALRWVHQNAEEFGVDPARVAVGGDSAGGGLAAALCQRVRDEGGLPVALQLLVYPMLDDRTALQNDHEGRGRLVWTPKANRLGWTSYLGFEPGAKDPPPYASPARCAELAGLPAAWIGCGDLDLFYREDLAYARRLEDSGVTVELHEVAGMYHGADTLAPKAPEMVRFRAGMTEALRRSVASPESA